MQCQLCLCLDVTSLYCQTYGAHKRACLQHTDVRSSTLMLCALLLCSMPTTRYAPLLRLPHKRMLIGPTCLTACPLPPVLSHVLPVLHLPHIHMLLCSEGCTANAPLLRSTPLGMLLSSHCPIRACVSTLRASQHLSSAPNVITRAFRAPCTLLRILFCSACSIDHAHVLRMLYDACSSAPSEWGTFKSMETRVSHIL